MEDMVRQSHSFAKQFVVGNVTQLVERRQVCAINVAIDFITAFIFYLQIKPHH